MTISNHLLAGTLVGLQFHNPLIAIPIAFASHFVLDAVPHFGNEGRGYGDAVKYRIFYVMEALDIVGFMLLLTTGVWGINLATLCAIVALSPDFKHPYRYFFFERKNLKPKDTKFVKFHQKIQWYEKPWGMVSEITFFVIGYSVLLIHFT